MVYFVKFLETTFINWVFFELLNLRFLAGRLVPLSVIAEVSDEDSLLTKHSSKRKVDVSLIFPANAAASVSQAFFYYKNSGTPSAGAIGSG